MFFTINICSKNLKSLNKLLNFLNSENVFNYLKIKFLKILNKNKNKKKILTILKSPHVNKSAQEQFEHKFYKRNIICFTEQPFLFILMLKYLKFKYLSDVKISVKFQSNLFKSEKSLKKNINFYFLNLKNKKEIINYLKFFELNGEFLIKSC